MDASVDGGLLLELYSREGAHNAAMISSDFYQVLTGVLHTAPWVQKPPRWVRQSAAAGNSNRYWHIPHAPDTEHMCNLSLS